MADVTLTKGSKVEVSSDEPGFYGAWYEATIKDIVPLSTKKRQKKKIGYLIKYDTLYAEDNLEEMLSEAVDPAFVRPLPPKNDDVEGDVEFEVMDVVDCYHRDGWWCGVVENVIVVVENGEDVKKKYVVRFEDPVEVFEFEKTQMRPHFEWVDSCWKLAPKKTPEQEVTDKNAVPTSESNVDAQSGFTTPSKWPATANLNSESVVRRRSSEKKKHLRKRAECNSEMGGVVDGSVTTSRKRSTVNSAEEVSSSKKTRSSADVEKSGSKENNELMVSIKETSGSKAINQDSPLTTEEMIITETCEAEDGKSQQNGEKRRGRPPKLTPRRKDDQEARTRSSSASEELTTDLDSQPLSVWYQGLQQKAVLKRSSCCNPRDHHDESSDALIPAAIVENGGTTEYHKTWPFMKRSSIWAAIESHELYQKTPQKPHFAPLKNVKEDCREGIAIAHMVTFANVTQTISDLQLNDPINIIKNSLDTLAELGTHGFNVGAMQSRLNELRVWKVKVSQLEEKVKLFEKDLEKHNGKKPILEKKINELEEKIKELQEKLSENVTVKKVNDDEIERLQSNKRLANNQIKEWELAFEKLAASPF
ncbi:Agenet-like domain-containing protein [Artemisia annua]|uniref:Agenet-like domain-containing protein n=1 Tax=Artemisia annua TaxID=35608 RepID=A0A2U1LLY9_ARTAN|nr:Agenet-like domain-containing protein [Artemisia annua]